MDGVPERLSAALSERYTLERTVGTGGMATVYLATDRKHGRQVAIKTLRRDVSASLGETRFRREIRIVARLTHPRILPLHDSGSVEGQLYFVMPFVEGESLRNHLDRVGRLSIHEALKITRQVGEALNYAHSMGVIHRDVKPSNILLSAGGPVIADFGIARTIDLLGDDSLTTDGLVPGTPMYMSPERGEEDVRVDSTADQYSLACVTFEMLSGRPPYRGATVAAVYAQHAVAKVPSIRKYRASVSQGVDDGLGRALAKKPSERFPSITAFTNAVTGRSDPEGIPPWDRVRGRYLDLMQRVREAPAGAAALLIGTVVLALTVPLGVDRILDRTGAYSVAEPRQSFVVVPTSTRAVDPEETVLATDVQHALIAQLNAWESARAVPAISLLGPARDLDLPATGITSLEQGLALARAHRVGTLVTVDVTVRNDSAVVEVNLFDVAAATPIAEALISAESKQDPWALARPITFDILGISGAPEDLELLLTRSSLPAALRQFDEGVRALERWRLTEAEAHFREATAADSTFGLAHHYLALTIHWQVSQMVGPRGAVGRTGALRSEIRRATNEALRHARSLTRHDSTHIAALHAFHAGDYQHSRELYQELTRRDSSDAYAWLMLGTVEFSDPWLVSDTSGAVHPRQNLNIARRAFLRTTRFWPDFFLGYGHLFDNPWRAVSWRFAANVSCVPLTGGRCAPALGARRQSPRRSILPGPDRLDRMDPS